MHFIKGQHAVIAVGSEEITGIVEEIDEPIGQVRVSYTTDSGQRLDTWRDRNQVLSVPASEALNKLIDGRDAFWVKVHDANAVFREAERAAKAEVDELVWDAMQAGVPFSMLSDGERFGL